VKSSQLKDRQVDCDQACYGESQGRHSVESTAGSGADKFIN